MTLLREPTETACEASSFVRAMRNVASSVTVVTTEGAAGRHGATVSAFCSVSVEPPKVLVCLKANSRIARQVECNGFFCVNLLPQSHWQIAERFAGKLDAVEADRFRGIDSTDDRGPMIDGATVFFCRVTDAMTCATHRIVIGQVMQVRDSGLPPLVYFQGGYHSISPQAQEPE